MLVKLKPLSEQAIIITGATSGIGLCTARMAAERGARVFLVARTEESLQKLTEELRSNGSQAAHAVADVADQLQVKAAGASAIEQFGGFDTWINNAAVSIYGRLDEVALADQRRLFETNYWGVIHGSLEAAEHLRNRGGAIINVGS